MSRHYDLVISNGAVMDGTGSPAVWGHVGIAGDEVRMLRGSLEEVDSNRVIDATGKVVCPGFIDFHAHSALMILADPTHEPKVRQGVTTELTGIDGNSYAPFRRREDFEDFFRLNAGLEGDPDVAVGWESVDKYLSTYDRRVSANVAYVVGNSPLRISSVGWGEASATKPQLRDMCSLLHESMEQGAFGMSTGLDYPPGEFASLDELVALSEVVADLGGIYHTHVRSKLGDGFLDPIREALEIGRRSGVAVHVTHLYQRVWQNRPAEELLGLLEDARANGIEVTFDSYPFKYGSSRLVMFLPPWTHVDGLKGLVATLNSKSGRQQLREELAPRGTSWQEIWLTNFRDPKNAVHEGRSVAEIAIMRNVDVVDAICDLLLEEDFRISFVNAADSGFARFKFMTHPLGMVGSDGLLIGEYPSPRTYGTFPELLGRFARDEEFLSMTDAVRKMTSFAARRLGLRDRGVLADGMKADIVVFDPGVVASTATRVQPRRFPVGIEYVVVNGEVVVDQGVHTGALPGRALKFAPK